MFSPKITVSLPDTLYEKIKSKADTDRDTISATVRKLLERLDEEGRF